MFKLKCEVTSSKYRHVMISRSVNTKTFIEICGTEKTKVELGYVNFGRYFKVDNQTLLPYPRPTLERGKFSDISKGRGKKNSGILINIKTIEIVMTKKTRSENL